ncbi:UNVERIFIED_CONTAM: hypothetical protein GTU68_014607 [Idotea baltica]|nr:hypothetical protein [Idotea baltica]
MSVPEKVL